MASEIAMLTTLEMQNVNFRQYYCVLGSFKNSEIRLINAMLTVVLVDGVVVDVDGVVVDVDGVVVDVDGVVVDVDGVVVDVDGV